MKQYKLSEVTPTVSQYKTEIKVMKIYLPSEIAMQCPTQTITKHNSELLVEILILTLVKWGMKESSREERMQTDIPTVHSIGSGSIGH
jgi:hypothetical protein